MYTALLCADYIASEYDIARVFCAENNLSPSCNFVAVIQQLRVPFAEFNQAGQSECHGFYSRISSGIAGSLISVFPEAEDRLGLLS